MYFSLDILSIFNILSLFNKFKFNIYFLGNLKHNKKHKTPRIIYIIDKFKLINNALMIYIKDNILMK